MRNMPFYHGTTTELQPGEKLLPAKQHGNHLWAGIGKDSAAYVTGNEDDAWRWAEEGRARAGVGGTQRVYEVEPGLLTPDANLDGPQFETPEATILRELPGPVGSQLRLDEDEEGRRYSIPDSGRSQAKRDAFNAKLDYEENDAWTARSEGRHPQLFKPQGNRLPVTQQKGYQRLSNEHALAKEAVRAEISQENDRYYAKFSEPSMDLRRDPEKLMQHNLSQLQFSENS